MVQVGTATRRILEVRQMRRVIRYVSNPRRLSAVFDSVSGNPLSGLPPRVSDQRVDGVRSSAAKAVGHVHKDSLSPVFLCVPRGESF